MTVRAYTKTDRAVEEIRNRILKGTYKSGMRLRQNELVEDLGLGVTPVREAFMQLISEGLLVRNPYAGVVVANITPNSVSEVYAVRKVLEKYATEQACLYIAEDELEQLVQWIHDMKDAHVIADNTSFQAANQSFHMTIYAASRNAHIRDLIDAEWRTFPRGVFGFSTERRERSLEEHQMILDALWKRDAFTAGALIVAHIAGYERHVLDLLDQSRMESVHN